MHPDRSDACLVGDARNGDKAAFGELIGRHYPLLLALCRRALGPHGPAEDAAQEAVLQALLGLDWLSHAERFGAWLVAIGLVAWAPGAVRDAASSSTFLHLLPVPGPALEQVRALGHWLAGQLGSRRA